MIIVSLLTLFFDLCLFVSHDNSKTRHHTSALMMTNARVIKHTKCVHATQDRVYHYLNKDHMQQKKKPRTFLSNTTRTSESNCECVLSILESIYVPNSGASYQTWLSNGARSQSKHCESWTLGIENKQTHFGNESERSTNADFNLNNEYFFLKCDIYKCVLCTVYENAIATLTHSLCYVRAHNLP